MNLSDAFGGMTTEQVGQLVKNGWVPPGFGEGFRSPTITLGDILTAHRRGRGQNDRITTLVTNAEG